MWERYLNNNQLMMKELLKDKAISRSLLLIGLASILQPYIVLITHYGRSNGCWNCLIIEQTLITSFLYLIFPLTVIYLSLKRLGINYIIQGLIVVAYYIPVSFVKITIPLFDDRIASWSTYSDQEIWDNAITLSRTSMEFLACLILVLFIRINRKTSSVNENNLPDEMKEADNG